MRKSLLDITEDVLALDDMLDECEGDVTGKAEAIVAAYMQENDKSLEEKVEGYCLIIAEREARASARKAEAARIMKLVKADEGTVGFLRTRLFEAMQALDIVKIECATHKVSIAKNGGKRAVEVLNEDALRTTPFTRDLFDQTWTLNKDRLRAALLDENQSATRKAGIHSCARFKPQGSHLKIK